jgi:hypothetical protein
VDWVLNERGTLFSPTVSGQDDGVSLHNLHNLHNLKYQRLCTPYPLLLQRVWGIVHNLHSLFKENRL